MTGFALPDLGEGLHEAEIVAWHVSPGDRVVSGQPLVSVETDKAVVEVPAPYSGMIVKLMAEAGEIVATGAPLVEIETEAAPDRGAIVGEIPASDENTVSRVPPPGNVIRAMPAARKLAQERNIDLSRIAGSGPDGAITMADVREAATGFEGEELRGTRRAMAAAMTRARATVVPATVTGRAGIGSWQADEDIMTRLVRAVIAGCRAQPALNAWFDGKVRKLHDHVDLAIAVDTPDGLFTPVLRNVEAMKTIDAELSRLRQAVKARTIGADAMKNATFTLSNFGSIGGEHASLVILPPQVAILGVGRISQEPVVTGREVALGRLLPLSLTFDHRVVTGGEAARFLNAVRENLEARTAAW